MVTRLRQNTKTEVDSKLADAKMMEKLLETEEFVRFIKIISNMRNEAMYMVLAVDSESAKHRERLRTLDDIIGLPASLIKRAKTAQEEES